MLQNFLAGFGGVGGACALITLGLKVWPGALDALATGLYSHVGRNGCPMIRRSRSISQKHGPWESGQRKSTTAWTSCAVTRSKTR